MSDYVALHPTYDSNRPVIKCKVKSVYLVSPEKSTVIAVMLGKRMDLIRKM